MRLLILAVSLSASFALHCPSQCDCGTGDELEYFCTVGRAKVTFNGRNNEYVNIKCEGANFTCEDLPLVNFGNNLPLSSLWVKGCSPTILPCVNHVVQTPSVSFVTITDGLEPLEDQHVAGLGDVQDLMIVRGPEKTIPVSAINSLPTLLRLRITGTHVTLKSDDFINSTQLEFLELSAGLISEIPEDAFNGLSKLRILNIWGNNFSDIEVNSLRGLNSLQSLSFNTNHLSHIAAGSLAHAPELRSILLLGNQLEELPPGLLYNLTQLENITIQQNNAQLTLHPYSISNLPSLKNLIIQNCIISTVPEHLLSGCDALITLNLSGNGIQTLPATSFRDLKSLERLDLSHNKITTLQSGIFSSLKQLKYLNLNRNYLEVLPDFLFSGLRNLNYVSIDHNHLHTISPSAFQGAIGLKTISLIANNLSLRSNNEYINIEEYSPFSILIELTNLYLNANKITTIFADWRTVLTKLENLNLSWNNFTILETTDFQFLSDNIVVDLQHNKISSLILNYARFSPNATKTPNSSVLLDNNPLTCDCGLYNLAMRLRGARTDTVEPKFIVGNARCSMPSNLKGDLFKNVSPNDLNCDLPAENCYSSCSSCQIRPGLNGLAYDCDTMPQTMPNPEDFGLNSISLKLKMAPKYIGNWSLQLLNLSNIGLKEVPFRPSKTVHVIDFSHNNLTRIPIEFLESNTTLYLSNNPFECHCWYSEEISILQKSRIVKDLEYVTCGNGGKLLIEVDVYSLCSSWRAAGVATGTFIVLILVVGVLAIIIYKNSHEIIVFIINHGLCPCFFVDDPDDIDKEYDVFVSYAHKDREYVNKLMPILENEFGLRTCVHYRDWSVGDFIPDQIRRSVENSRKTIILLSSNSLDSGYANMEFRAAHNLALKEGKNRIILILLEDVSKHEKLSEELKAHMKMNTFLKWDDARFSERLQRAVPLRRNKKFMWPEVFKQTNEKTVKSGLDVQLNSDGQLVNVAKKDAV